MVMEAVGQCTRYLYEVFKLRDLELESSEVIVHVPHTLAL